MAVSIAITLSSYRISALDRANPKPSDLLLYWAVVDRIAAGEGYYEAAAEELTSRGYPTHSVFNWRTPLPMWLLGHLPEPEIGKWLLVTAALAMLFIGSIVVLWERTFWEAFGCGLLLSGTVIPCLGGYVSPNLWSGILLGLSICGYGINRPSMGVLFGIAAAFFRELAFPYCVVMAAMAAWQRRRVELIAWTVGITGYSVFYAFHATTVSQLVGTGDVVQTGAWMRWGGLPFVIACAQMNGYLLLLPQWITAVYLSGALLGFAGWHTPVGRRVTAATGLYLTIFLVVGKDVNQYWGTLISPLLCFGFARAPASLVDLWYASRKRG